MGCSCWNDDLAEEISLHTRTVTGLVATYSGLVMPGNQFVMVMKNVDVVD